MADAWAPIDAVYVIANPHYEPGRFERVVQHLKRHNAPEEKIRIAGPTWGKTLTAETCFQVYDPFLSRPRKRCEISPRIRRASGRNPPATSR